MTRKKPLVVGNWKMNKTASEATKLIQQLSYNYEKAYEGVDVVICPPFTALRSAQVTLQYENKSKILIGAQDVFWEASGAYTGAVSPEMLKDVSCSYCIVGHSERREVFAETNEEVAKKVAALVDAGVAPIICCGETAETREAGRTVAFVTEQIRAALSFLKASNVESVVLAYEPIWAIGTGHTPIPEQADEICAALRDTFKELFSTSAADSLRVLYGGSINPGNVNSFARMPNIDGGLVGGASLNAEDFMTLVGVFS